MKKVMLKLMAGGLVVKDVLGYPVGWFLRKLKWVLSIVVTECRLLYRYHLNRLQD